MVGYRFSFGSSLIRILNLDLGTNNLVAIFQSDVSNYLIRSELVTTNKLDRAIAAAPYIGCK